jgi:hypothetical protein
LTALITLGLAIALLGGLAGLGALAAGLESLLVPGGVLVGSLLYHPMMTALMRGASQEDLGKRAGQTGAEGRAGAGTKPP